MSDVTALITALTTLALALALLVIILRRRRS
jgi:hypothetical protein